MFITCTGLTLSSVRLLDDCRRAPRGKCQSDLAAMFLSDRMTLQLQRVKDCVVTLEYDIASILQFVAKLNTFDVAHQFHVGTLL